jgi:hypothetical protein
MIFFFQKFEVGNGDACGTGHLKYQAIAGFLSPKLLSRNRYQDPFFMPDVFDFSLEEKMALCLNRKCLQHDPSII